MNKRTLVIILIMILIGVIGYFLPQGLLSGEENSIYIHITGAVKNPGIVSIPSEGTVKDAIDAAGGTLLEADLSKIDTGLHLNSAQPLDIPYKPCS